MRIPASPPSFAATGLAISSTAHLLIVAAFVAHWLLGGTSLRVAPPPRGTVSVDLQASWSTAGSGLDGESRKIAAMQIAAEETRENRLDARELPTSPVGRLPPADGQELETPSLEPTTTAQPDVPDRLVRTDDAPETVRADELPAPPRRFRTMKAGQDLPERSSASAWTPPSIASRRTDGATSDARPQKTFSPQPNYPPELLAAGISGVVKLRVRVNSNGRVGRLSVYRTSGYAAMDRAALEAVRGWKFEPARQGGIPISMEVVVPVRFSIRR